MNEIILDQVAIWTPKATNGCSVRVSPAGVSFREKGSNVFKKSEAKMYRYAKNFFVGGEPVVDEVKAPKQEKEAIAEAEETENTVTENIEETETKIDEEESPKQKQEALSDDRKKFCLFVRTFENSQDIERKLDDVAKLITEQETLAALGRAESQGPMSFEYTKYNLGEID